jgi:catechol 2,3-dioxygenase-like lactoylglutathione lyase family enzyme
MSATPSQDFKLEVVVIPVSDVARSKRFYTSLGWRLDGEFTAKDDFRAVQMTPPGSPCSVHFGHGVTAAKPGSAQGMYLIVADIEAACAELQAHGVAASDIFHRLGPGEPAMKGLHPQRASYSSFATFSDPDGNTWLLQEVTSRLPGRVDPDVATYTSASELTSALQRAAAAHGEHEKRTPGEKPDDWPEWYAAYMLAEQTGKPLPT